MHSLPLSRDHFSQQDCVPIQPQTGRLHTSSARRSQSLLCGRSRKQARKAQSLRSTSLRGSAPVRHQSPVTAMAAAGSASGDLRVGFVGLGIMGTPMVRPGSLALLSFIAV